MSSTATAVVKRSFRRPGKIVPAVARRLRGRAIRLAPGGVMAWHSTGRREELLVALAGSVHVAYRQGRGRARAATLQAGQCAFIPSGVWHRVVNLANEVSRYLYVTG